VQYVMSTLLLSLLLIFLVGLSILMHQGQRCNEHFADMPAPPLTATMPSISAAIETPTPKQIDVIGRGLDQMQVEQAENKRKRVEYTPEPSEDEGCRKPANNCCPKCPDMSQYIKLDEVPCWNCTLP